jgi:hypothetical protein
MAFQRRVAGLLELAVNGDMLSVAAECTWNTGGLEAEMLPGMSGIDGYRELPTVPYIDGLIRHVARLDTQALKSLRNATVNFTLPNGHVVVLRDAIFAGPGEGSTGEGTFKFRFEGVSGDVIIPAAA